MRHAFHLTASRISDAVAKTATSDSSGREFVAWLGGELTDRIEGSDISAPNRDDGACGVWVGVDDERFRLDVRWMGVADLSPLWLVALEHHLPRSRSGGDVLERRRRFDALVAALRGILLKDIAVAMLAEEDD
jgi:hypothetical protein